MPAPTAQIRSPGGELQAEFIPGAGMVGWSLSHRGVELVAHPQPLDGYAKGGHPSGIPLLHPWANRLASPGYEIAGRSVQLDLDAPNVHTDPHGLPIHGLVAGCRHWEVAQRDETSFAARLDFAAWPELLAGFPFPHVLELTIELDDQRLTIGTELTPTGDVAVPIAFGFHPYLQLPGTERDRWLLELPVTSRLELDQRQLPTGSSDAVQIPIAPLGERTFDDAYDGLTDPPEFAISDAERRVSLRFCEGYTFAQVYTPAGADFIAFEPMTAPPNPFESDFTRLAEPGSSFRARFEIEVSAAADA